MLSNKFVQSCKIISYKLFSISSKFCIVRF